MIKDLTELISKGMSVRVAADIREMTAAAREATAGDTRRAETAAGLCQRTWREGLPVSLRTGEPNTYRQHRCGRQHLMPLYENCTCRYCGADGGPAVGR